MAFSVYGNCQSRALGNTLLKNDEFQKNNKLVYIKPIHTLKVTDVQLVEKVFRECDLLIHQKISDNYRIKGLSTTSLMLQRKANSLSISMPSLYFNAYFPHLDNFPGGVTSVLNKVHDYIIMYSFVKGMNSQETLDLIQDKNLYTAEISSKLLKKSLDILAEREINLDIKISDYIKNNFQDFKLFNQYNHPKGIVFDHIANQIFYILSIEHIAESITSKTILDNVTIAPVYKSTYENLGLRFKEDFLTYSTNLGQIQQDEVVSGFISTYKNMDKDKLKELIMSRKPFIIDLFRNQGL